MKHMLVVLSLVGLVSFSGAAFFDFESEMEFSDDDERNDNKRLDTIEVPEARHVTSPESRGDCERSSLYGEQAENIVPGNVSRLSSTSITLEEGAAPCVVKNSDSLVPSYKSSSSNDDSKEELVRGLQKGKSALVASMMSKEAALMALIIYNKQELDRCQQERRSFEDSLEKARDMDPSKFT